MTHVMLDLETWGKLPGCDIRSIGAVVFDPIAGNVAKSREFPESERQFYNATDNPLGEIANDVVNTTTVRAYRLTRDLETVDWWAKQSPEAQEAFFHPIDLREACERFSRWLIRQGDINDLRLWANDPHFDEAILVMVYRACGLVEPWHYRSPRSMKTICDLANITRDDMAQFNHGTAHNALDDAISQAMIVCEGYKRLGLQINRV